MKTLLISVSVGLAVLIAIGASFAVMHKKAIAQTPPPGPEDFTALQPGFTPFADHFLTGIHPHKGKNFSYSPLSMQYAVMLLGPGLGPADLQKLATAIGVTPQTLTQTSAPAALTQSLDQRGLSVANSVWVGPQFELVPAYQSDVKNLYGADAYRLDQLSQAGADQINHWVDANTNHRIPKLFDSLTVDTTAVLVNAFTFDGKWLHPFEPDRTGLRPWHGLDESVRNVTMMKEEANLQLSVNPQYTVGRMPYRGIDMEMDIVLPRAGLDPWETFMADRAKILGGNLIWNHRSTEVEVPKFELRTHQELTKTMESLGLGSFTKALPDQKMVKTNWPLKVSIVVQATWVKVDEEGTKAAAATSMGVRASAMPMPDPREIPFVVDHPFVFVIRDNKTGAILFVGAVYNPEEASS